MDQNIFCTCGFSLCTCEISSPVRATASGWMPLTPAATVRKPAVSMPGWTTTTISLSLSTTSSSTAVTGTSTTATCMSPMTPIMTAPEIGGVRGPCYPPSDKALQLISNLDSVLAEKDHTIATLSWRWTVRLYTSCTAVVLPVLCLTPSVYVQPLYLTLQGTQGGGQQPVVITISKDSMIVAKDPAS